tara:strand:- start:214 stop:552 length:339 start_codon:yes stop_codon:yes gene_type:complete
VEESAGEGARVAGEDYLEAGGSIVETAAEVFTKADMIVKVKEPQDIELNLIRQGQVVFTYFHFAASEELTRGFVDTGGIAIAYETVQAEGGSLPLFNSDERDRRAYGSTGRG